MEIGRLKLFGGYFRAYSSESYKGTMRAVEHLASTSLLLLDRKSEVEKREILAKAQALTEKLSDVVASEAPMVGPVNSRSGARKIDSRKRERTPEVGC